MRKIIAWVATTLDGYMEGSGGEGDLGWLMPFVEESLADNTALLQETDTILLGRQTYHGFSQYWPSQDGPFADLMNTPTKIVVAHPGSLERVEWGGYDNVRLIDHDVPRQTGELKNADGRDIVILASGGLVSSLLATGLIDELRVVVCPVALGAGKTYLRNLASQIDLKLTGVQQYANGSVLLTYEVAA
jgi:dihydrofolate reductase